MIRTLRRLFAPLFGNQASPAPRDRCLRREARSPGPAPDPSSGSAPPELPHDRGAGSAHGPRSLDETARFPEALPGLGNLDAVPNPRAGLEERERKLLVRIGERILAGKFDLPQLPSTTLRVMEMSSRPGIEVEAIVETIASDPTLSGEFLRVANSALFAGAVPTETLQDAVVRLGRRTLRSVTLSISMRGAILKHRALLHYAEEVWRQAYSVAVLARLGATHIGMDPERGFLLGLMHDVGKVSLLSDLATELERSNDLSPALVGGVFSRFHEVAGEALARAWGLSPEIASVAGTHHRFELNAEYPQSAALVCLAHKMDLYLSMGAEREYWGLARSQEMSALGVADSQAAGLLAAGARGFSGADEEPARAA